MREENTQQKQSRSLRIFISLVIGTLAFIFDYKSRNTGEITFAKLAESLSRGLLTAIASAVLAELWSFKSNFADLLQKVSGLRAELASIQEHVLSDERILFGRSQLSKEGRLISVLGIEAVDPVPEILKYSPQNSSASDEKWERSISILRFDRIQDLLFSPNYLEHFFTLRQRAEVANRILVINDAPRSKDAIGSFLQISYNMDIKTYVYLKSEFYIMLESIGTLATAKESAAVREIMRGNPELNIMVRNTNDFQEIESSPINANSDYVLRYLAVIGGGKRQVVTRAPGPRGGEVGHIPGTQVGLVLQLMSCALKDARLGLQAFRQLVSENGTAPENYWSPLHLQQLKGTRGRA